jgi:hypothetical protein
VSAAATGELLVLFVTVALAIAGYRMLRGRTVVYPSALTRIFGGVMTAHAVINLIGRNLHAGNAEVSSTIVANVAALIFLAVYANVLWRHQSGAILAALSLLFASYTTFMALTAAQWVPFAPALVIYASAFAVFGLVVGWISMRETRRFAPTWSGRGRALRS